MTIDKQALRQLATNAHELGIIKRYSKGLEAQRKFYAAATPLVIRALLDELEAKERRIADQCELLRWVHDTLLEINPYNYTHDDVCEINNASVEVILGIAPVLGETHGKSEDWWASRAAGIGKVE